MRTRSAPIILFSSASLKRFSAVGNGNFARFDRIPDKATAYVPTGTIYLAILLVLTPVVLHLHWQ